MKRIASIIASAMLVLSPLVFELPATAAAANLIANPSVETATNSQPQNWTTNSWGTNSPTFTYEDTGHTGSHSLGVSVTNYSSGDAKWMADQVAVTPGQTYTYSDYYESSVNTELDAAYTSTTGAMSFVYLATVPASSTWSQTTSNLTVPAGVASVSIYHIIASNGSLQTDDFSLSAQDATPPPPATGNLIANPSVETANGSSPDGWETGGWGTNNATFTYENGLAHTGSRSVQVSMSSYTSGDAKWYFAPVTVQAGSQYTYSDYYESSVATDVVVQYEDGSGNDTYKDLGAAAASNNVFKQYTASFTVPASVVNVTVFHLIAAAGTLTTDDFSLTQTTPVTSTGNLVPNPLINTADASNAKLPDGWSQNGWGTNTATTTYKTTGGYKGSGMAKIKITSYTSGDQKFYFNPVAVTQDTQYNFTDYYKATVQTQVVAVFNMSDGSTDYEYIGLPKPVTTWTKFSSDFSIPLGTQTMTVYHLINSVGTLTTSNFSMAPYTPVGFNRAIVSLTFDDGYQDTYDYGLPILQAAGMPSTQFVISGLIGQTNYMTPAEVQTMYGDGQEIASHTVTHDDMTKESASQLTTELSQSQATLEGWIGAPVTDMAYPFGLYNSSVQAATSQYYSGARGVEDGLNSKDNFNADDIKVENIYDTTTTAQVADWVAQAQATNTWLVLVYHSVDPSSTPFGGAEWNVSPTQLTDQLAAIKSSGIAVETMQQALAEVNSQL